ncbi:MAG: phosphatidate cytidylyltransferase [Alphaproteobacteria bacterium]|nr:phosphatidate cytidylyltransferase [Alphaproteobacteria bacterium]
MLSANLARRIISAAVLIPLALAAVWAGGAVFDALIMLLGFLAMREWLRLMQAPAHGLAAPALQLSLCAILAVAAFFPVTYATLLGLVITLMLSVWLINHNPTRGAWMALGLPYIGGSCLAMMYVRDIPQHGFFLALYTLTIVWTTDTAAYVFGRWLRGPLLAPNISPAKTWAGFLVFLWPVQHPLWAMAMAALLSVVSQTGDLFESFIKRQAGAKESGGIIPGHGGVLDRIDGLVFTAAFLVVFQLMLGDKLQWW